MHRARKVQAGEDKTAYNGLLDANVYTSVCYMRHVVHSHVLWSVDHESLGARFLECWKFSKVGFYPGLMQRPGRGWWVEGGLWRWSSMLS